MNKQTVAFNDTVYLYDREALDEFSADLFDRDRLQKNGHTNILGRGSALMFRHGQLELVLKHYQRGGLWRHIVQETYIYTGLASTRMWREFHLLAAMRELGLPVPTPIAARCQRTTALTYRGDLITQRIPDSQTLAERLAQNPLPAAQWEALGATIKRFHLHHIYHADLNANNILIDRLDQVHLIDFDKGAIRPLRCSVWQPSNIHRLRRSLLKLQQRAHRFYFSESDWATLLRGYSTAAH